jgi:hypothetical protein
MAAHEAIWSARAERSGDGASGMSNEVGNSYAPAIKKRCRRFALPPHSKILLGSVHDPGQFKRCRSLSNFFRHSNFGLRN